MSPLPALTFLKPRGPRQVGGPRRITWLSFDEAGDPRLSSRGGWGLVLVGAESDGEPTIALFRVRPSARRQLWEINEKRPLLEHDLTVQRKGRVGHQFRSAEGHQLDALPSEQRAKLAQEIRVAVTEWLTKQGHPWEPGWRINALVAETVMGWSKVQRVEGPTGRFWVGRLQGVKYPKKSKGSPLPHYSECAHPAGLAVLKELVEQGYFWKLAEQGYSWKLDAKGPGLVSCTLVPKEGPFVVADGKTIQHAICLAALRAAGLNVRWQPPRL